MKRKFYSVSRTLLPVSALVLGLGLTACSDSDSEALLQLPDGISSQVQLGGNPSFCTLPIEAKGEWTVSVVNDDDDWLMPVVSKGTGNKQLLVSVDRNYGNESRSAQVRFSSGGENVDFTIVQGTYNEGADGANSVINDNLLSYGIDLSNANGATDIERMVRGAVLSETVLSLKDVDNYVMATKINKYSVEVSNFLQAEESESEITASLSVNMSYGLFKLGLNGDFKMYGSAVDTTYKYAANVNDPKLRSMLKTENLYEYVAPWDPELSDAETDDEKKAEEEKYNTMRQTIFSTTFLSNYQKIVKLVDEKQLTVANYSSNKSLKNILGRLKNQIGPVMITGATKGGSINIDFMVSKQQAKDSMEVNGKLDASFTSLFSLNADAAASYLEKSASVTEGSMLSINATGGTLSAGKALASALTDMMTTDGNKKPDYKTAVDNILTQIVAWDETLTSDNCGITNVTVMPIWNLFDGEAAEIVKHYMKSQYPNAEDGSCPYLFNVQKM